jgi:hypothetical protein
MRIFGKIQRSLFLFLFFSSDDANKDKEERKKEREESSFRDHQVVHSSLILFRFKET